MNPPITAKKICLNPVNGQLIFAWMFHPWLRDHRGEKIMLMINIGRHS